MDRFVDKVKQAIAILKTQYGYSHDRATHSLLYEISRHSTLRPIKPEIFKLMKSQRYGFEDAGKIVIVQKALDTFLESHADSPESAIDALTNQISLSNMLNESNHHTIQDIASASSLPDVRIEGVAQIRSPQMQQKQQQSVLAAITATTTTTKKGALPKTSSKSKLCSGKHGTAGRKRSIDEVVSTSEVKETRNKSRARADSVAQELDAKVTATNPAATDATTSNTSGNNNSTTNVRPKRDSASSTGNTTNTNTSNKRSRTTNDASSSSSRTIASS